MMVDSRSQMTARHVSTACGSGRVSAALSTRPLPQAVLTLLLLLLGVSLPALAQSKKSRARDTARSERAAPVDQLARSREEFIRATKEYRTSLETLLAFKERDARKAEESLAQLKQLYAEGLISKRALEEKERALEDARSEVERTRQQINQAETQIAGTLLEVEAEEQMAKAPPVPKGNLVRTTSYLRFNGAAGFSLSDAWKVQQFFQARFGRPLPVTAFGQSALHDRWRLDHRNAMDVSLNPTSAEGQAVIAFLRSNGIPFAAFTGAIPGTATGPHIHVGRPSHRY
jgi:hypothetical protein